jgi:hypothetical protein
LIAKLTFALLSLHASATAAIGWDQIMGQRRDCAQALQSEETFAFRDIRWQPPREVSVARRGDRFNVLVDDHVVVVAQDGSASPGLVTIWWTGRVSTRTLHEFVEQVTPPNGTAGGQFIKQFDNEPRVETTIDAGSTLYEVYGKFLAFEAREWQRKLQRRPMTIQFESRGEGPLAGLSLTAPTGRTDAGPVVLTVRPNLLTHPDFRTALHELIDATSADYLLWPHIAEAVNAVTAELKP